MTSTYAETPTHARRPTRLVARSRPGRPAAASARPASDMREHALRTRTVARASLTGAIVALLALTVLVLATPQTVLIPLAVVLLTGLAVGGLFHLVEVRTRPHRAPAEPSELGAPGVA